MTTSSGSPRLLVHITVDQRAVEWDKGQLAVSFPFHFTTEMVLAVSLLLGPLKERSLPDQSHG